jgi:GT2 family glycosyltransferase
MARGPTSRCSVVSEEGAASGVEHRLTVAVSNYNGRRLLSEMLASLARQTLAPGAIVVVDDCSDDDSQRYVTGRWPQVRFVVQPRRMGVTAAMNRCLAEADTEFVALFNNDIELDPGCLRELVAALERDTGLSSAGPKMRDFSDRNVLDGAGDILRWRGGATRRGHGTRDDGQYDHAEDIFGPCGGAAIYRRAALDAVGLFDEAYFAYYEDVDWAFRAQLLGFRCRYVPSALVYHHGSATLGRGFSDFNGYHLWRNSVWLMLKCAPAGSLLRHAPSLLLGQAGNLRWAIRERKLHVWARAMRDALRGLPAVIAKRRRLQHQRVIGARELDAVVRLGRR